MHFEQTLRKTIYAPWKDQYIDYPKLKRLLRDEGSEAGSATAQSDDDKWTDKDEEAFVEELVNVQLEKVHNFQSATIQKLRDNTSDCETKLDPVATQFKEREEHDEDPKVDEKTRSTIEDVLKELDAITEEMSELEKFSRINYTGFLKATKKHDRKRGHAYRVRPLMQVRLAALPFNKEDYSPLLFRLSTMYNFCRQTLDGEKDRTKSAMSQLDTETFTAHKFWVHPENLLELKTVIMRRLPVLVYNPQTSRNAEGTLRDPTITSIYFDNPQFSLYNGKVGHASNAASLRLRWFDHLSFGPEIYVEKKIVHEDDTSEELKLTTKPKYIQSFLAGEYKMEKDVQKLKDRFGDNAEQAEKLQSNVEDIQNFVKQNNLQPVLRANYSRTAFQIPGDNRVRITLDTDLAMIREDALDVERPCRDPEDWHRTDIDDTDMEFPFDKIRKGEINRFPYALLEIRLKGDKQYEWVSELMSSHLVKNTPRFSKFVQGVAALFDDFVNSFPFWLGEVGTDIRRDPQEAFEEEQEKKAQAADDEFAVGSFLRTQSGPFKPSTLSPAGSPMEASSQRQRRSSSIKATSGMTRRIAKAGKTEKTGKEVTIEEEDSDEDDRVLSSVDRRGFKQLLPSFSMSKYAQARRHGQVKLPPGVHEPTYWIKDEGPVKIEAKVWLANQRTFIRWQHVSILLATLSLGLYNAASVNNNIGRALAVVYTIVAIFAALWGLGTYIYRANLIMRRSGKDFDNVIGPLVVCLSLIVALLINFGFQYHAALQREKDSQSARTLLNNFTRQDFYVQQQPM